MSRPISESLFYRNSFLSDGHVFDSMSPDEIDGYDQRDKYCYVVKELIIAEYTEIDTGYQCHIVSERRNTWFSDYNEFMSYVFSMGDRIVDILLFSPRIGTSNYMNLQKRSPIMDWFQTEEIHKEGCYLCHSGILSKKQLKSLSHHIEGINYTNMFIKIPHHKLDILKICIPEHSFNTMLKHSSSFNLVWYPDEFIIKGNDILEDFRLDS